MWAGKTKVLFVLNNLFATDEEIDSLDTEVFKEIDELKKSLDTLDKLADGITKKENKEL